MWHSALAQATVVARSGTSRATLLEVYSSEGCSSCPPAEEWISRLANDPRLWIDFVPVVFHVDYWDYLGWPDRLASHRFTERQTAYASAWWSQGVYTPGFVLNGHEWRDWHLFNSPPINKEDAGELSIDELSSGLFQFTFRSTGKNPSSNKYKIHAALLGFGIVSEVKAGENTGKTLHHDFAIMDYAEAEMSFTQDGIFQKSLSLKSSQNILSSKFAVAAWISEEKGLAPLQVAGGILPVSNKKSLTILAIGDSTTAGTPGFRSPAEMPPQGSGDEKSQYAYWMMQKHPEWQVINRGINGQRSDEILGRFEKELDIFKPQVVIILAGVNDVYQGYSAQNVQSNLESMIKMAQKRKLKIIVCTILPYNSANNSVQKKITAVNRWITSAGLEGGFVPCDTFNLLNDPADPFHLRSSPDGLHPSADGYKQMGEALADLVIT